MIVYNVTVKIDEAIHEEWRSWMQKVHIPDVMATGCFTESKMFKVLGDDNEYGITYACQYWCKDLETLERYQEKFAPALQADHKKKYEGKYAAFRTLLQSV